MQDHATAERRSLRYHRAIASRIESSPAILERARARADLWLEQHSVPTYYAQGWKEILSRELVDLCAFLVDGSEHARAFRQVSPFAGALSPKERWQLWAAEHDDDAPTT